jgi:hypothetical protein
LTDATSTPFLVLYPLRGLQLGRRSPMRSLRLAIAISAAGLLPTSAAISHGRRSPKEPRRIRSARVAVRRFWRSQLLRWTHQPRNCATAVYDVYLLAVFSDIHHLALGGYRSDCSRPGRARITHAMRRYDSSGRRPIPAAVKSPAVFPIPSPESPLCTVSLKVGGSENVIAIIGAFCLSARRC